MSKNKALSKNLSRRGFLGLSAATGSVVFLGAKTISPGKVMCAYADETGQILYEEQTLTNEQILVSVVDVSDGNPIPVEGFYVRLDNGKELSVTYTTHENGLVAANVKKLDLDYNIKKDTIPTKSQYVGYFDVIA